MTLKRFLVFVAHTIFFSAIGFYAGKQSVTLSTLIRYKMVHKTEDGSLYLCPMQRDQFGEFLDREKFVPTPDCKRLPGCPVCGLGGWRKLGPK